MKNINKIKIDNKFSGAQTLAASMLENKDTAKNQRNSLLILVQSDLFICVTFFFRTKQIF